MSVSSHHKIKVAHIITRMDWGGSPDIIRILCARLDPNVYEVSLVFGRTKYPSLKTRQFLETYKGKIVVIPQLRRNINVFYDSMAFIKLAALFHREKFDIVHTHTAKAGALGRLAAFISGVKVIVHTPHGHNFYGYFSWFASQIIVAIEKFLAGITDTIIALTEIELNDFIRFHVAGRNKLAVISQGLELKEYMDISADRVAIKKSLGVEPHEIVVGFIGRLEQIKGPQYFIEAAKHIVNTKDRIKFIVVGEGSLRPMLERQAASLTDRFIFTGWREDIPALISILDVLVLPSLNEAVGMILIEAQAQGVPVVASRVGGIPEVVKDKETGFLFPSQDAESMAGAVMYLLDHPQERDKMSCAAREWVKGKFNAEVMVTRISQLYQDLLKGKQA